MGCVLRFLLNMHPVMLAVVVADAQPQGREASQQTSGERRMIVDVISARPLTVPARSWPRFYLILAYGHSS